MKVHTSVPIALMFCISWLFVLQVGLNNHEDTHVQIFKYYGCEQTHIERQALSAETTCSKPMTQDAIDNMYALQMQSDIKYYHDKMIVNAIFVVGLLLAFTYTVVGAKQ